MRQLKQIPWKGIWYFVEQHQAGSPPVFWELVPPSKDVGRSEEVGRVRRRSDSNTIEIAFALDADNAIERDGGRLVQQEFAGIVRRYAEAEDARELQPTQGPLPAGVEFELESRVPVTERDTGPMLAVIGPGGRATAYRGASGITGADVTIRRRSGAWTGVWRPLHQIMRPVEQAIDEDFAGAGEEPSVQAAFGYFELSKYEVQSLMRPVFLFVIEQEQDSEGRWPGLQRIVVSPATTAGKRDDSDGLGMWAESFPCSGRFVLHRRRI